MSLEAQQLAQVQKALRSKGPTPWLRESASNSPLARKARSHLRCAVELLEQDVAERNRGLMDTAERSGGRWQTRKKPLPTIKRDNVAGQDTARSSSSNSSALIRAAAAASAQRREQYSAALGVAGATAGPDPERLMLKRTLLKLEAYLKHNMLRGVDMLRWSEKAGPVSRSTGPFMCWLTNCGAESEANFCISKLRGLLQKEIAIGDLKMQSRELELLLTNLDNGRGKIDYQKLRKFTTSSYVHRLGTDHEVPEKVPVKRLRPVIFRQHREIPMFIE